MTMSALAARAAIGSAALALIALAMLHVLKPELHPGQTMISRYALGRFGWLMALCFAAFGAASASLFAALVPHMPLRVGRAGLALLLTAAIGFVMAARFPMDPVSTPPARMSFAGRMHGVAFLVGVPSMLLAALLLSVALGMQTPRLSLPLMTITAAIWVSLISMIAIMLMVGPGRPPDRDGPGRFVGWPNRSLMVAYAVWVIVVAWPMAMRAG